MRNIDKEDFTTIGIILFILIYLAKFISIELNDFLTDTNTLAILAILVTLKIHYSKKIENDKADKHKRLDLYINLENMIRPLTYNKKIDRDKIEYIKNLKIEIKYIFDDNDINNFLDKIIIYAESLECIYLQENFNKCQTTELHMKIKNEYNHMNKFFDKYMPDKLRK